MRRIVALLLCLVLLLAPSARAQFGNQTQSQITDAKRVLCSIRAANFNIGAGVDIPCTIPPQITAWLAAYVITTNCTISMTTANGSIFTGAGGTGTSFLGSHAFSSLTGPTILEAFSLLGTGATVGTRFTVNTVYLRFAVAQGSAGTCDVYVSGFDLT